MTDAIAARLHPFMVESSTTTLPLYRAELSQLYAETCTLAEAKAAVVFFGSADGQALLVSPTGRKIIALAPRKSALDQKWFNYSVPGLQDRAAVATAGAMVDHIGKTDPELAGGMRENLIAQGALPKT